MKKYGLQLRVPASQQKQQQTRPPLPPPAGFRDDDDDNVEAEIARQAYKNKALKDVEEQQKKALEEDPSVFDYDGVYDEMKEKITRPIAKDRQERKSKYIEKLIEKAKEREREHEIIYERKLARERNTEDHLYADKEKFVTGAYKKKLAEQAKWMEEQRLRELREEREDVTKKSDLSDFYFNLHKNVAFGGNKRDDKNTFKKETSAAPDDKTNQSKLQVGTDKHSMAKSTGDRSSPDTTEHWHDERNLKDEAGASISEQNKVEEKSLVEENPATVKQTSQDRPKLGDDALAAAKERYLARKKMKLQ